MLQIRPEQVDTLSRNMLEVFIEDMAKHLSRRFPESVEAMEKEQLIAVIRRGIDAAKRHDILKKYDVKRFLEYRIEFGDEFGDNDQTKWAGEILSNDDLSATRKMDKIDSHATFARGEG